MAERVPDARSTMPWGDPDDARDRLTDDAVGPRLGQRLRADPRVWIGGVALAAIVTAAIGADVLAPYDPNISIRGTGLRHPSGPTEDFLLGTDRLGRDYLSRLIHGARTSLVVGIGSNVAAVLIGAGVGATAGMMGTLSWSRSVGRRRFRLALPVETLLMRLTDVFLSLPVLVLALALVAVVGQSLLLVVSVIAAVLWTTTARVVYTRVRVLKQMEFVIAARSIGASEWQILARHITPHIVPLILVYTTLGIAAAILFEAALSFLGVGVPLPAASWGTMISEHVSYFRTDPRLLVVPGLAMAATVLAFNLVGDALTDALDPTSSQL